MKTLRRKVIDWTQFKTARLEMRLTMSDVAEYTGISLDRIASLESGRHTVLGDAALKLFFFYQMTEEEVLIDLGPEIKKEKK